MSTTRFLLLFCFLIFHRHPSSGACCQFSVLFIDDNRITGAYISFQDQLGCKGFHIFLQIPFQRSCAVHRIVAALDNVLLGILCQFNVQIPVCQTFIDIFDKQINNSGNVFFRQRTEHDDLIQTVQKFRTEMRFQFVHNKLFIFRADVSVLIDSFQQVGRTDIGSHNQDCIFKIHRASLGIRDPPVVKHLKENEPEQYAQLVEMDELLRDKNPKPPMDSDLFISRSRKRIEDLTDEDCDDAECFEYCGRQIWNGF